MIADAADGRVRVAELESGNLLGYGLYAKWLLGSELFIPIFQSLKVMTKDTSGLTVIRAVLSAVPLITATGLLRILKRRTFNSGHGLMSTPEKDRFYV